MALALSGLWLSGVLWKSPDYEAQGTCTKTEINHVYEALKADHAFKAAAIGRMNRDFWAFHPHLLTLQGSFERTINATTYQHFGKRKTAAFWCNHANIRVGQVRAVTVPQTVALLKSYEPNETQRWQMATFMALDHHNLDDQAHYAGLKYRYEARKQ